MVIGKGPYRDGRIQPEPHGFDLRVPRVPADGEGMWEVCVAGAPMEALSYFPSGSV